MTRWPRATTSTDSRDDARLLGLAFDSDDDTIHGAVEEGSVPALLMSMVHITGGLDLLRSLPSPYALIAMDLQGAMSEPDKDTVRRRAFDVIREYRDRGCPPPHVPDDVELREMLQVLTAGEVTEEFVNCIAADLRLSKGGQTDSGQHSTDDQRRAFPVVVIGCGEAGLLAGITLQRAGIPNTIIERLSDTGGTWRMNDYPGFRVDIPSQCHAYSFEPTDHWTQHYPQREEILSYLHSVADSSGPRREVCAQYNRRNQAALTTMVYTHPAVVSSCHKNSAGEVSTLFGGRIFDYWNRTLDADPDEYDIVL